MATEDNRKNHPLVPTESTTAAQRGRSQSLRHYFGFHALKFYNYALWLLGTLFVTASAYITLIFWSNDEAQPFSETTYFNYVTQIGQTRSIELEDSSLVDLNADAQLQVKLGSHLRKIVMSRGEAYFRVAPDKLRPFVVETHLAKIAVIGTEFNVDEVDGVLEVEVYEGIVRVSLHNATNPLVLRAGEGVRIHRDARFEPLHLTQELPDWKNGWMEIENQPLSYVIAQINRYSDKKIILQPDIRNKNVSGRFDVSEIDRSIHMLVELYNLRLQEYSDSRYLALK